MPKPTIEEQIKALAVLRAFRKTTEAYANNTTEDVVAAIHTLDDGDVFADLDQQDFELNQCGDTSAGLPEPPCDLDKPCPVHDASVPVIIEKNGPLFQARGVDDQVWSTATTYRKVEEHLDERGVRISVVTHEEMAALKAASAPTCRCGGSFTGEVGGIGCSCQKEPPVGLPELKPGEEIRPAFSDTHPRAARELGDTIRGDQP